MILIGLGSNLPHPEIGTPEAVLRVALQEIHAKVGRLVRVSPFLSTQPVPISDQPWYQNAVCEIESQRQPAELLADLDEDEASLLVTFYQLLSRPCRNGLASTYIRSIRNDCVGTKYTQTLIYSWCDHISHHS